MRIAASHALVVGLCLLTVFPFAWVVATALAPAGELPTGSDVLPSAVSLDGFRQAFALAPVDRWLLNSVLLSAAITIGKLLISVPAAYAFACLEFRGRGLLFALVVGTMIVPDVVTLIPNYILISDLGWLDQPQAVVLPAVAFTGFYVFLLRQAMLSVPRAMIDAAIMDGASTLRVLANVVLPMVRPVVAVVAILAFLGAWNLYLWPQLVLTSDESKTLVVGLQAFAGGEGSANLWGPLMAMSLLAIVPPLLLFVIAQRAIVRTFTDAAVKG